MTLTKIGASLGGSADIINVTQTSHTFVSNDRGKAVRMNNNSGTPQYVLAIASGTTTADAIGIIIHVTDGNNFTMATSGRITVDYCVPNEVAGTVLFLSHATAGVLTSTEPSAAGHVSKPMAVITIANSEMIMLQQRGEVISTGAVSIADGSVTNAKLANMATRTVKANATSGSANPTDVVMADGDFLIANASGLITAPIAGDVAVDNTGASVIQQDAVEGSMVHANVVDDTTIEQNGTQFRIKDGGVTLAKIAHTNNGNNGLFLRHNGSGSDPTWAAAGGANLVYLGTAVASSSSSISVTWTDDSEYVQFLVLGNEFRVSSQYAGLGLQLGDSSGMDTGSSDYQYVTGNDSAGATTSTVSISESLNRIAMGVRGINNASGYPCSFALWVSRGDGNVYNMVSGTHSYREHTGVLAGGTVLGMRKAAITVTRVAVVPNTGNMPTGRLTVWGVKHE